METVYKVTTEDFRSRPGEYNEVVWGAGVTHDAPGTGELCGPGWIHAYSDPLLAGMMNPAHGFYSPMILWECDAEVGVRHADKLGCRVLTTVRQIAVPEITIAQRQAFAILAARAVYEDPDFRQWADDWLSGKDRSDESAAVRNREARLKGSPCAFFASSRRAWTAWEADGAVTAAWAAAEAVTVREINLVSIAYKAMSLLL